MILNIHLIIRFNIAHENIPVVDSFLNIVGGARYTVGYTSWVSETKTRQFAETRAIANNLKNS